MHAAQQASSPPPPAHALEIFSVFKIVGRILRRYLWLLLLIWLVGAYAWQFTHMPTVNAAATWTQQTNSGSRNWQGIASSADGTRLIASVSDGGYIYTSTDSGATWTEQTAAGSRTWYGIASSGDGNKVAAAPYGSYIWTANMGYPSASGGNFLMGMEF